MFSYYTEVCDSRIAENGGAFRGQIGVFHGYGQSHDTFLEMAMHYALNGFIVHLIDLEGFGYSGGGRVSRITIESMHLQITSLLTQVRPDLPLFLFGHSMGCMVLNTYLTINPKIADRLAGVIWSAPFWGMPEFVHMGWFQKQMIKVLSVEAQEFCLVTGMP